VHSIGRLIHVIDTINPVVVLNGLTEVTYSINEYIEEGATASDNSNEVLTVSISTFDDSVDGDYNVTYTATDSTGNMHSIGRLVHIEAALGSLVYSNPTTNIFNHTNFQNYVNAGDSTLKNFTIANNATTYINGDYQFIQSTYFATSRASHVMILSGLWYNMISSYSNMVNSHIYGDINYAERNHYEVDGTYVGSNCTLNVNGVASGTVFVKFDHYCDSNLTTYAGEYLQWTFPFYVEPSKFEIVSVYQPKESVLMGSNDNGATWDFIHEIIIPPHAPGELSPYAESISSTKRYSTFKWIITNYNTSRNKIFLQQILLYGDIYK
jgi:hypothetical protein